jgi:glucose/arabinose dehydrogenase
MVLLAVLVASAVQAVAGEIVLRPVVSGLDRPVQVVSANDHRGRLFIAEQTGPVLVLDRRGEAPRLYVDLSPLVDCCDNGGLLSIVFHPQFAINGFWFALYVNVDGDTVVARYTGDNPSTARILFVVPQPKDNVPNHHGGTLQFGVDGFLYISIGDGGAFIRVTDRAQQLNHLLGKILRIDVDRGDPYAIPPDNPFVGIAMACAIRGDSVSIVLPAI